MLTRLRTALVVLLTVGLLALFLRHADIGEVASEIRHGRVGFLLLALVSTACTYVLRALRWQYLLRPIGTTRFANAFRTTIIGFAATSLLPGRVGEVLRPYLLARREGLSATATFATIILERLLDMVAVLVFLAAFLLLFDPGVAAADPRVFAAIKVGGIAAAAAALAGMTLVFFLAAHPEALAGITLQIERFLPARVAQQASRLVRAFAEGLAIARRPARLAAALLLSFPLWATIALGIWLVSLAFGMTIPYTGSFLLMAMLVVGVAVPTPGAVGGFHEAFRLGATAFYAVPNDRAIGAAIVLHAISFVPVAILGLCFLAQEGMDLTRARRLARVPEVEDLVA
jgi:glycosyltransferase 2 family protein